MLNMQRYKIVFGGTMGAGKTEAITTLSEIPVLQTEALNTDTFAHEKMLTTVGIDYGEISLGQDAKIGLYGTPGQARFQFMWPLIAKGALGIILLIDHSSDQSLEDLKGYLNAFGDMATHEFVIGITHVDEKPDKSLESYRQYVQQLDQVYPVFAVDARKKDDIFLLINCLINILEQRAHAS
jgi:signal recognition particle receptor subunit beta